MRLTRYFLSLFILLAAAAAYAQPVSYQGWQSATIASGAITLTCYELLLPHIEGQLLSEPSPTSTCGQMCQALSSGHPVKVALTAEGGGPADSLTAVNGCTLDGARISLAAVSGDTITVEDTPGVIELVDDVSIVLDDPIKILTLQRKDGVWVAENSVGGASSGGNITVADGAKLDFADPSSDNALEGLFVPGHTSCANFIGFRQFCYDTDDELICLGNGTGITCLSVAQCATSVSCINNQITSIQTNPFIIVDNNNDGFRARIGASGPVWECVEDIGGTETLCTPSEIRTVGLIPGSFTVDGTHCVRNIDATVNAETVPVSITCADNDLGLFTLHIPILDRFDGTNLIISAELHSNEATPAGDIELDWRAYCVETGESSGTGSYPAETANGTMTIDLDSLSGTDRSVIASTVGDIPMSGCSDSGKKSLWLRAELDATGTTADNLTDQHLIGFWLEYGSKAYTD